VPSVLYFFLSLPSVIFLFVVNLNIIIIIICYSMIVVAFTGTWWREFLGAVCIVLAVLFGPVPDWIVRKLAIAIKGKKSKAE